jgi:hypothetical protein
MLVTRDPSWVAGIAIHFLGNLVTKAFYLESSLQFGTK